MAWRPYKIQMNDKIIKYGIVGVGGFGSVRRKTLRETGRFQIIGGVDIDSKIFEKAALEEDRPLKRYETVETLVADPEIEAIFVASPPSFHVDQAMVAAKARKAVFVEKPLGYNYDDCLKLVEYCEENNIPHGHGFGVRFLDLWQKVKSLLNEKALGQVISISVACMQTGGLILPEDNWRFDRARNPGGPLFQSGIHKIDLLRFLFGEGKWLAGFVNRLVTKSATDDTYVLLGTFGGVPATLHCHYVASSRYAMEIYGTRGSLFISEYPTKLEHKITDLKEGLEPVHDLTKTILETKAELRSLCDFADAVRDRKQPAMSGREGLKSLKLVLDAAELSIEAP
jgi:1,5-anhydro-D-fructose reductase (1,5-anhydro-D-mannitol-forming)